MRFPISFVLLVCVSGAFGQPNSAYYVSTAGSDSNPGTQTAPWRTVQHPQTPRVRAVPSTCEEESTKSSVSINASGNASDGYVTFRSYPGETATLDAGHFTPAGRSGITTIHNQSYVRIEDLEIRRLPHRRHGLAPFEFQGPRLT